MATHEKVDIAIVGAGASGSVFAAVMAAQGKKVVILEQGPDWQLSDLISSDIWGRRIKPAGGPFILEGRHRVSYGNQGGWGVGGAALHYFANFPRLLPDDFHIKSTHGRAHDWPIAYEDVAPYYDKVARDLGVSGDAKAEEVWRPAGEPYPMPPMKTFRNGDIWLKGFEALGIRMVPAALGMNSVDYKGRPACIYDGWCHVGCPIGALANPLVTYLADARTAGAEVRPLSTVTRVLSNDAGTRVTGVEYYDRNGERQVQEASAVVLAAWAAQNPRIMLNSATVKHTNGLANSSGLVGKYMMTHFASGTFAIFDEDVQNHMGTTGAQYMSYDRYDKTSHKNAFGSSFIVAGFAIKTNALAGFANTRLDLFGPELDVFMRRAARGLSRINAFGEELPNIENRVELTGDKDAYGMPLGRIIHSYDKDAEARCGMPIWKKGSGLPRPPARKRCGLHAAPCRRST
jgi:choline dehydrogenase-like flavoprotein